MTSNLRDIALRVCRGTSTSYITRLVITDNYTIIKDTFSIIVTLGIINSFLSLFSLFFLSPISRIPENPGMTSLFYYGMSCRIVLCFH